MSQIIETGISDFHKILVKVSKVYFKNKRPTTIQYRELSNLCADKFIDLPLCTYGK